MFFTLAWHCTFCFQGNSFSTSTLGTGQVSRFGLTPPPKPMGSNLRGDHTTLCASNVNKEFTSLKEKKRMKRAEEEEQEEEEEEEEEQQQQQQQQQQ